MCSVGGGLPWRHLSRAVSRSAAVTGSLLGGAPCNTSLPLLTTRVYLSYSPYDSIRRAGRKMDKKRQSSDIPAAIAEGGIAGGSGAQTSRGGPTVRYSGVGRPLQADAQDRRDATRMFPETLPSGRPAQQRTVSQQLYYAKGSNYAAAVAQENADREYTRQMHTVQHGASADRRFFRPVEDYRDITDSDPYAGVLGERAVTQRVRTSAWQRQFEAENHDTFLPYERTNVLARLAPNWFVRYFVNLRDKGGADHLGHLWVCALGALTLISLVCCLFYTPPSQARPVHELR